VKSILPGAACTILGSVRSVKIAMWDSFGNMLITRARFCNFSLQPPTAY